MNLFDIMRSAGGGDAFSALAKQYGLTPEQISAAVGALMPGFSAGLRRSASDPFGLMQLMRTMALNDYARAYREPAWALTGGRREGDKALTLLFGSPEIADKTAELAAAYTGLAQDKLRELQVPLAAMMLGGIADQSRAGNPMLDAMLKSMRATPEEETPKGKGPLDRYEEEQAERERAAFAAPAQAMGEMAKAGLAAFEAGSAAWQKAAADMLAGAKPDAAKSEAKDGGAAPASPADLFGEMLEPGVRLGEAYQRQVTEMLERMQKPVDEG